MITGAVLGAIIGAGIAALPFAFGVTGATSGALGIFQTLVSEALVGAMFGAFEFMAVSARNGPEGLLISLLISVGISAAISVAAGGALKLATRWAAQGAKVFRGQQLKEFQAFLKKRGEQVGEALGVVWEVGKVGHTVATGETVWTSVWNRASEAVAVAMVWVFISVVALSSHDREGSVADSANVNLLPLTAP